MGTVIVILAALVIALAVVAAALVLGLERRFRSGRVTSPAAGVELASTGYGERNTIGGRMGPAPRSRLTG